MCIAGREGLSKLLSSYPILFADTDPAECVIAGQVLRQQGFDVRCAQSSGELSAMAGQASFAVAVIGVGHDADGQGDVVGGMAMVEVVRRRWPDCQIIAAVPPNVSLDACRRIIGAGAIGFVETSPGRLSAELYSKIDQALTRFEAVRRESAALHDRSIFDETGFAGQSRRMAEVLLQARRAAAVSDAPVLIEGESGTGKQLLAEAIHQMDPKRKDKPFLVVNCSAITGSLAESALFGHSRGAFTGATTERPGYFRSAAGGVILLDEIGEMELSLQPKLLRVLQYGVVLPVGADRESPVDVRVVAATNRSLMVLVAEGKFRLDLYQRLNVIALSLPPLRQRPEDIPVLFDYFVGKYSHYYNGAITGVDPRVYEVVGQNLGEGNVRELENIVRRVLTFKRAGARIELADLPSSILSPARPAAPESLAAELVEAVRKAMQGGQVTLDELMDRCERAVLSEAMRQHHGSKSAAARRLGITRRTLYNKLSRYNFGTEGD
mgnify:CR=1 FL=1